MQQIQLSDRVYEQAQRQATAAGFASVNEYIEGLLDEHDSPSEAELERIFTPERIAELERIAASVDAGAKTYSLEEVDERLRQLRAEWRSKMGE